MTHYAPPPRPTATSYKHERVRHSPRKLNLLAKLVRRLWVPDALAQLQFTPKRFAPTVAAAIERCAQRAAAHYASQTDVDEAFTCGTAAVQAAVQGQSGYMVKLVRESDEPYRWTTGLQPLDDIANVEHFIPRDWIAEDGWLPNEKFETYARPLIQGELHLPTKGGLPAFARLKKLAVEKQLPAREA